MRGCYDKSPWVAPRRAFDRRQSPLGVRLNAIMGSDIGHFDVPDISRVLPSAYELVEDEVLGADDFRRFVFDNPVRFFAESNPRFFEGTPIEQEARALLDGHSRSPAA